MTVSHVLQRLPSFLADSTSAAKGPRVPRGEYPLTLTRDQGDIRWHLIQYHGVAVWIVAESPISRNRYARESDGEPAAPASDVLTTPGPWATALAREQAGQPWVAEHQVKALEAIPGGITSAQENACRFFIGLFGIQESAGSNRGLALDHFVLEYRERWQIASTDLAWCALVAQVAQFVGLKLGDWKESAPWKTHPLKDWIGASSYQEKAAVEQGLWVPIVDVLAGKLSSASACGALAIRHRRGSGSDVPPSRPDAPVDYYPGHTDLVISLAGGTGSMHVCSGNISDTAKYRLVKTAEYRGLVPLIGA